MNKKDGYCECGCGEKAPIAKWTNKKWGHTKGMPVRFIRGHHTRGKAAPDHPRWQGGRYVDKGHVRVKCRSHPRSDAWGYVYEHLIIAEAALGRPLPTNAVIHHADGNGENNERKNLVVCENQSYHLLLHQRQRALSVSGHSGWIKCAICGEYDNPENLYLYPNRGTGCHRQCRRKYERDRYRGERGLYD